MALDDFWCLDMADMARFVVAYHYGGTYMDLDFYCHRPLLCLEEYVLAEMGQILKRPVAKYEMAHADILVVSREPILHAEFIHKSSRVVIQDFLMVTPKHPFIKWFLDNRTANFINNPQYAKTGPFSYNIHRALDEYYAHTRANLLHDVWGSSSLAWIQAATSAPKIKRQAPAIINPPSPFARSSRSSSNGTGAVEAKLSPPRSPTPSISVNHSQAMPPPPQSNSNSNTQAIATANSTTQRSSRRLEAPPPVQYILELQAEVLHPLLDASNSRIAQGCRHVLKAGPSHPHYSRCDKFDRGSYLNATPDTILVHMWTHTFLGKTRCVCSFKSAF